MGKTLGNIDLGGLGEIRNANFQNLAVAPDTNLRAGRFYFNTADATLYVYDGTKWVDALSQGDYTFQNGIEMESGTRNVQIKLATSTNAGNITFTADTNGLAGNAPTASTSTAGLIEIATDSEVTTGTSETLAVNPKQLATKVDKLSSAPTAGTYTKVTINSDGLVTTGGSLQATDIPDISETYYLASNPNGYTDNVGTVTSVNNTSPDSAGNVEIAIPSKISDLTDDTATYPIDQADTLTGLTATVTELNYVDGVTSAIQDQLNAKVAANADITGATKCKITYDSKGLVTSGADLEASDIPSLTLSKISDVTATATEVNVLDGITASTSELNIMDGVTVTASDINSVTSKIGLTDLSIGTGSTNYLTYDNTTGAIGAKVDTTVTDSSTNLVTSGAVSSAIGTALVGGIIYRGTWDITSATDYSGITLPVKKGYLYYVIGTGPVTIGGIEWNAGDYLLVNDDVASGGSLTGKVEKIDNTESADIVRTAATQTLTNKTIDADDNTITDLTTSNLKSGVLQTTVRAESSASDTALASEKAVATAIKDFITASSTDTLTNKTFDANGTGNSISNIEVADFASGVVQTTVRGTSSASDTALASEKAIATALTAKTGKLTADNPALTLSSGQCTWTITNTLGTADVVCMLYEISSNEVVWPDWTVTSSTITVKMNAAADISANTYRAVIIG